MRLPDTIETALGDAEHALTTQVDNLRQELLALRIDSSEAQINRLLESVWDWMAENRVVATESWLCTPESVRYEMLRTVQEALVP